MTRKDYVAIARELNLEAKRNPRIQDRRCAEGFSIAAKAIMRALRSDNPNFDGNRFLEAADLPFTGAT